MQERSSVSEFPVLARHVHAAEKYVGARGEGPVEGFFVTVPFPGSESSVSGFAEHLRERLFFRRDNAAVTVYVHQPASGQKHCPARLRHSPVQSSHHMSLGECRSGLYDTVHVRRFYISVPQRVDRLEILVVGKYEDNIGAAVFFHGAVSSPGCRRSHKCRCNA